MAPGLLCDRAEMRLHSVSDGNETALSQRLFSRGHRANECMNQTISTSTRGKPKRTQLGFNLVEVMVAVWVIGLMILALYGGFSYAFSEVRLTRENIRASQILSERMEVVRLMNWDEVAKLPGYIPATFSAPFNPGGSRTNGTDGGFSYTGTVAVTKPVMTENYSNDLRMIQIQVTWNSGNALRSRQMTTFASQYGMQRYVY
jgi:prepilin-type N-terminal cleavage/methylation domain-containing protein